MKYVVIADDSRTSRMFIRRCLEIAGVQDATFLEAADGREALTLIRENPEIDLLVTDLNMPNMDGATLLKELKRNLKLVALPVLVITSAANPAKEAELEALGAFGILRKPVSPADLLNKLGQLIDD